MSQIEVAHTVFYKPETNGACAGVFACDRTHQTKKTATTQKLNFKNLLLSLIFFIHGGKSGNQAFRSLELLP